MESKKYLFNILLIPLLFLFSCEKEYVVIEEKLDDVLITDTVFTEKKLTINDTVVNETKFYSFKTSQTQEAIADASMSQLFAVDLRYQPNGRRGHLNTFAWTNFSAGEPSFDGRSIIRFNELNLIDENATVDSAFITLFVVPPSTTAIHGPIGNNNVRIHVVNEPWEEYLVTWDNQPSFSTVDFIETDLITEANDSIRENITSMAQQMVNGNNYGFLLKNANEDAPLSAARFFSSDYGEINKRPYLTVYYHEK